jgi:hypothetical protein
MNCEEMVSVESFFWVKKIGFNRISHFQPHYQKQFSSAKVLPILFAPYKVGSTLALLNGF